MTKIKVINQSINRQACFFWKQSVSSQQVIPDFAEWGWKLDKKVKQWIPFWTYLPDASSASSLLLHCGGQNHVKATASVPGQAYVAHLYASAMPDVSTLTINNGLQWVMVCHMWYILVISYNNVGEAQLINVTEICLWCGDCILEIQITINVYQGPTLQTKFDQHKYWTAAANNASISMKNSSAYFAIWVKVPHQSEQQDLPRALSKCHLRGVDLTSLFSTDMSIISLMIKIFTQFEMKHASMAIV